MKPTPTARGNWFTTLTRALLLGELRGPLPVMRRPFLASTTALLLLAGIFTTNAEGEGVYGITDVMVTDNAKQVPAGYTGISEKQVTLPYVPGQLGERVNGTDVNRGVGGTTTTIWVKYERLPEDSAKPVLIDIEVRHWVGWKVTLPEGPGWTVANGTSARIRGALTTGTKGSVWRNGLVVRYAPSKDAGSRILALYLSVTSSSTPSQPALSWPVSADVKDKSVSVRPAGVDIHRGGGGAYFFLMKCLVEASPARDPLKHGLTILTYNAHLFKNSNTEIGNFVKKPLEEVVELFTKGDFDFDIYERSDAIVFEDDKRARLIAQRIRESGADIIALQEVWADDRQAWFCRELKDIYPYSFNPPQKESLTVNEGFKTTSGLVLLSKYRLTESRFVPFPTRKLDPSDEESFARKGLIAATVELWPDGPKLRVGVSHACTDTGGAEQPNIKQIANETLRKGTNGPIVDSPAIMMGDFNVNGIQPDNYGVMKGIFEQVGAVDAYRKVRQIGEADFTSNLWGNLLYQLFNPRKGPKSRPPDILDYVFVKESGGGLQLTPVEAGVPRDWKYPANRGWWRDVWAGKWASNYVAVVSFQLKGHPHLFGLKENNTAYISRINDDGKGWTDIYSGRWASNYVGTAITAFTLNGHPHIFGLKRTGRAYISRINDDGKGWTDIYDGRWAPNYVAVVSFELNGHPYLFGLKTNNTAYISRINDDGKGWKDIYSGRWSSSYVGTAITPFYLDGHPYIFALKKNNTAYVSRINDDGRGWKDVHEGRWASNYVAVRSFQLDGHPYLFGLKTNNRAYISRINDDGRGWKDIYSGNWSSNYVGSAFTTFDLQVTGRDGDLVTLPHMFALKGLPYTQGWISRFSDETNIAMDLSDHYPVWVKFRVTRTDLSRR
jgi:endonuclease/exonuclease/phosphatase family metal-dependent hydrolase